MLPSTENFSFLWWGLPKGPFLFRGFPLIKNTFFGRAKGFRPNPRVQTFLKPSGEILGVRGLLGGGLWAVRPLI
jgi:hypothetical protein